MKTPNHDVDSFIEALRGDLPSAEDEARVRSRLLAAGMLVTSAAVTTPGAALGAQAAGAAAAPPVMVKAGLVSKLLMLPVAAKVGVAMTLALGVAATSAPLVVSRGEAPAVAAPASQVLPSRRVAPPSNAAPRAPSDELPQPAPVSVQPRTDQAPSTPERREPTRRGGGVAREPAPAERAPAPRARASSLAEETRLMERAMLAAGAGRHELARRWLDEHARRFPEGLLARERERAVARLPQAGDGAQTSP